ncbi:MAG: hypothetical protein KDC38_01040, partial [Planctomycetes bacterium]|nr:hypothetical protein [Planctomycetota bacterium]
VELIVSVHALDGVELHDQPFRIDPLPGTVLPEILREGYRTSARSRPVRLRPGGYRVTAELPDRRTLQKEIVLDEVGATVTVRLR